jgi:hypothetical protein
MRLAQSPHPAIPRAAFAASAEADQDGAVGVRASRCDVISRDVIDCIVATKVSRGAVFDTVSC